MYVLCDDCTSICFIMNYMNLDRELVKKNFNEPWIISLVFMNWSLLISFMNSLHIWLVEWLKFLAIEFSLLFDNDKGGVSLLACIFQRKKNLLARSFHWKNLLSWTLPMNYKSCNIKRSKELLFQKKQKMQNLENLQYNCSCHALYQK